MVLAENWLWHSPRVRSFLLCWPLVLIKKATFRTLCQVGWWELLNDNQTQIVDLLTFECKCTMCWRCQKRFNDLKHLPAPPEIMHFDNSIAESELGTDIFYWWQATIKGMSIHAIHVSVFCNVCIELKAVMPLRFRVKFLTASLNVWESTMSTQTLSVIALAVSVGSTSNVSNVANIRAHQGYPTS